MKAKIFILIVAVGFALQSCASHCGNKNWRTARFVQQQERVLAPQQDA